MKFTHDVIHNGTYYRAGEEIPQSDSVKQAEKEVKPPVKKRSNSGK